MATQSLPTAGGDITGGNPRRGVTPEPETVEAGFLSPTADTSVTLFRVNPGVSRSYAVLIAACLERSMQDLEGNGASLLYVADFCTRAVAALRVAAEARPGTLVSATAR